MNAFQADVLPNTPPWYAWRRQGITATDVAVILGCSPYEDATIRRLVMDKCGLIPPPETISYPMRRGQLLEPKARKMLQDRLDVDIYVACVEHRQNRHHRASLDGFWTYGPGSDLHLCELKALNHELHQQFGRVVDGEAPVHSLPLHLLIQCQWQLYVTGAYLLWFCNYSQKVGEDRQLHAIRLYPEPVLWGAYMLSAVDAIWPKIQAMQAVGYGVDGVSVEQFDADFREVFPDEVCDV